MRFEVSEDMELIREVMTHPRIWPGISHDFSGDRENFQPQKHPLLRYVTVRDQEELLGLFLFVEQNPVWWEVHTCLLPNAWGERATAAAVEMAAWVWRNSGANRITTSVPAYNRLALKLAHHAGMLQFGVNEKSYPKREKYYDQILLGLTRPESD